MRSVTALVLVAHVLIAGCAAPEVALDARMRQAVQQIDAVLLVPQNRLEVAVLEIDGGTGGFLGSLLASAINAKRQDNAEKDAEPLLAALTGYDFRAVMAHALAEQQARYPVVPLRGPWRVQSVDSESHRRSLFDAAQGDAVLFVHVGYRLQSGNLFVVADAQMFPKSAALAPFRPAPSASSPIDAGNAVYRRSFPVTRQQLTPQNAAATLTDAAAGVASLLLADLASAR